MSVTCDTDPEIIEQQMKRNKLFHQISGFIVLLVGILSLFTLKGHIAKSGTEIIWLNGSISLFLIVLGSYLVYKGFRKEATPIVGACCSTKVVDKMMPKSK